MKRSKKKPNTAKKPQPTLAIWQLAFIFCTTLLLVTWVKQQRLRAYWQQTYQQDGVWVWLNRLPVWQQGAGVADITNTHAAFAWVTARNQHINGQLNKQFYAPVLLANLASDIEKIQTRLKVVEAQRKALKITAASQQELTYLSMATNQKVFFAGDSLMQGVAPWVMRDLLKQHHINSINLSKQSTGLSYASFFDWPATIEQTLRQNPDIGVLVIFLGANDPWAVPDPNNKGGSYVEFATPRWQQLYQQKIQRIVQAAQTHHVQVMWLTPPQMKKTTLNQQMQVLTDIFQQTLAKNKILLLDSKPLLTNPDNLLTNQYDNTMRIDGKMIKVRTADGIHFTIAGQKQIATAIFERIHVLPN